MSYNFDLNKWVRRGFAIILTIALVISGISFQGMIILAAENNEIINGVIYTYDSDNDIYSVNGYTAELPYDITLESEVNGKAVTIIESNAFIDCINLISVTIPFGITRIDSYAFESCENLTNISIPSSVTNIRAGTFGGCSSLISISIPSGITRIFPTTFQNCSNLTTISLPSSLVSIDRSAFEGCSSLTNVMLPPNVNSIGDRAFRLCSNLNSINIPSTVTEIGYSAFNQCRSLTSIDIPSSITGIEDSVFQFCKSLTNISIPDSVTSIGDYAFYGCSSLVNISIPDSVINIGDGAFSGCSNLTSIDIPSGVTRIGDSAFSECQSLTSVNISSGVTSIGDYAFDCCGSLTNISLPSGLSSIGYCAFRYSGLTNINIPASVTSIGEYAFTGSNLASINVSENNENYCSNDGILFSKNMQILCFYPKGKGDSYTIPSSVTSIGNSAFSEHTRLTSISFPSSLTSIGNNAFSGCFSLSSISFPSSLTSIGTGSFAHCISLTSIEIPSSVTSIGDYAFFECSSLTSIEIPSSVISIGYDAFLWCDNFTIWGEANSYAQLYATNNNIPFRIIGSYKITYYLDNGTNNSSNPNTYTVESNITLKNPTRNSYTFDGWYTDSSFKNRIIEIAKGTTGNLTLYAKWVKNETANTYQVSFNQNKGTKLSKSSIIVTKGKAYGTLPTVVRKGYTLKGWYTQKSGGSKVTAETLVTLSANQTLYAQWTIVKKPSKVTVSSIKNSKSKQITVKLKKVSGIDGYEIVYSTNQKFKSSKKVTTTSLSKIIKSLKKEKTYHVKARAYKIDSANKKVYGNYGNVKVITINK